MTSSQFVHPGLSSSVISEIDLLKTLNIELSTLQELRLDKKFPVVKLNGHNRVYLVSDVLAWLKQQAAR